MFLKKQRKNVAFFENNAYLCPQNSNMSIKGVITGDIVDSTFRFAQTVREVSRARFIFVPNRINLNEEKSEDFEEARKQSVGLLKEYGWVTPRIKRSKVARKYRTIKGLDYFQRKLVEHPLDCIVERLKK